MMTRREFIVSSSACFTWAAMGGMPASHRIPLMLEVKRLAIHDGPGIRTTFFVKGCPLRCIWCHNPESISTEPQIAKFAHLCRHCTKCTKNEATCPTRALRLYGKPMTINELVRKAIEDKPFYEQTGGGITLSGGEPLFFPDWTFEFLSACKKAGLHTCLDTSLYAPAAVIEKLLPVTDMWLPDFKVDDSELHQKFTGVSNESIKANLKFLVAAQAKLQVRCLVVPGLTDDMPDRYRFLESIGIGATDVVELKYQDSARSKYQALGLKDTMPRINQEDK